MSDLVRCHLFAIDSLDKRAYCEGFCVHIATFSGVTERTIGKRLHHCIDFIVVFISCYNYRMLTVSFPCARVL